ncbi:MAG: hypothetical protein QXD89_01125 [Candidatus Aenigmatarchaeota archaeon]
MVEKTSTPSPSLELLSDIARRVKNIEIKVDKLEEKVFSLENELEKTKNDIKAYGNYSKLVTQEISSKLEIIEKRIKDIEEELKEYAKKGEIEKIKTLIEFFNPLKSSFVTREEFKMELERLMKQFKVEK